MRIFVTGATGWIGAAVVADLLDAGHQVVGLARSDSSAAAVRAAGADVLRGGLDDLDVLSAGSADSDGVVHLAFRHDIAFSGDFDTALESDLAAIEAIGGALAGTDRPLAIAAGITGLRPGALLDERDAGEASSGAGARVLNERAALALVERGVRAMSIRFAPTVHGDGDTGFLPGLIAASRTAGEASHVAGGDNRWPAVHRSDAARLVRLGVEGAPAGSVLHAVGEEAVTTRDIVAAIGRGLDVPVTSITADEAQERYGFLAGPLTTDMPASSSITRQLLSWEATGPSLLEDLGQGHYFAAGRA